jgi:hypothetical protein
MSLASRWFSDPPRKEPADFAGRWFTSFGSMTLARNGTRVSGTYGRSGTENTIEGSAEDGVLTFRYHEAQERGAGWFKLRRPNFFAGAYVAEGSARALPWQGWRGFDGLWDTSIGRLRLVQEDGGVAASHEYQAVGLQCSLENGCLSIALSGDKLGGRATAALDPLGFQLNGEWHETGQAARPFGGQRVVPRPGLTWLVVLEAHWQRALEEAEFAFGNMLRELFARLSRVQVRHRFYHDEASLLHWCRQLLFVPDPVLLVITGHGEANGLAVNGKIVPMRGIVAGLAAADGLQLLHFSSCLVGQDSEEVLAGTPFPISGYTTKVDWAESALTEFIYFDMILEKGLQPIEAARQLLSLVRFAGNESIPGSPYSPAGFRFFAPPGEPPAATPSRLPTPQ